MCFSVSWEQLTPQLAPAPPQKNAPLMLKTNGAANNRGIKILS